VRLMIPALWSMAVWLGAPWPVLYEAGLLNARRMPARYLIRVMFWPPQMPNRNETAEWSATTTRRRI
jgi:hypothetical protein